MTDSLEPKASSSFHSGLFLVLFSLLCLALTGAAGYVKMKLDGAEISLFETGVTSSNEEALYQNAVLQLGYGGFLGAAQTFMNKMDKASLAAMSQAYEIARNAAVNASKDAPEPVRRDIKAVLDVYHSILVRAQTGQDALSSGITQSDLIMAAGAMQTLESRLRTLNTRAKDEAQAVFRQWSLALLLLAWSGAFLATCLTVWTFGVQDRKNKAPLRSLAQSVANIAKGDVDTPLWGLERTDEIGDLARELDITRRYFAQIPDLAIASENGTRRLSFTGESRSLFKNMMKAFEDRFGKAVQDMDSLNAKISQSQDAFATLHARVDVALEEMRKKNEESSMTVGRLAQTLEDVARSLDVTHEENAGKIRFVIEQLIAVQENGIRSLDDSARAFTARTEESVQRINQTIPFLQERARAMADTTQSAAAQVAQSLSSLFKTEETLRGTASSGQQAIKQLMVATGQMGERMLAALNLMQASGKRFNETTDTAGTKLGEALQMLERGSRGLFSTIEGVEERMAGTLRAEVSMNALVARTEESAIKMEGAVASIAQHHETLSERAIAATHRMETVMASFDAAERAMTQATDHIQRDSSLIGNILTDLRKNNEQLLSSLAQSGQAGFAAVQNLAEKSHALMQRLEVQIQSQSRAVEGHLDNLTAASQTLTQQASLAGGTLGQAVTALKSEQEKLSDTRTRFIGTLSDLGMRLEEHAASTFGKTEELASKSFTRLTGISEQVENVMKKLSVLGQLTGTLGTVAGQLGQIVPALTAPGENGFSSAVDTSEIQELIVRQTKDVLKAMGEKWHEATLQIEAMNDQLAQVVVQQKDQLETRLVLLDKKLRETNDAVVAIGSPEDSLSEKQGEILNELVTAIAKINEHVMELDDTVEQAGLMKKGA